MNIPKEQGPLPFVDTVEYVQDLRTGEDTLRKKKVRQRQMPTPDERRIALSDWLVETDFEKKFQFGAEAWKSRAAVQSAEESGQSVEYFSGWGAGDDAEFSLKDAFDLTRTRFRPIRSLDIAKVIRQQTIIVENKLQLRGTWVHSYADWVVDLMGESRNLSEATTKALKKYVRQGILLEVS